MTGEKYLNVLNISENRIGLGSYVLWMELGDSSYLLRKFCSICLSSIYWRVHPLVCGVLLQISDITRSLDKSWTSISRTGYIPHRSPFDLLPSFPLVFLSITSGLYFCGYFSILLSCGGDGGDGRYKADSIAVRLSVILRRNPVIDRWPFALLYIARLTGNIGCCRYRYVRLDLICGDDDQVLMMQGTLQFILRINVHVNYSP